MNRQIIVKIYSDTICPWCYIGKCRYEKALREAELSVETVWMPYQLNPDIPKDGMERKIYLGRKFGGSTAVAKAYHPIQEAGQMEGIRFVFDKLTRTPNTLNSHRLIHYAKEFGVAHLIVGMLFVSYFERAEDIGNIEILVGIAAQAGLDSQKVRVTSSLVWHVTKFSIKRPWGETLGYRECLFFIIDDRYKISGHNCQSHFYGFLILFVFNS